MISETYREVEVVLLEDENKWRFTVNGRERTAPSLPKAREYIDNALDAVREKKEKSWEPFFAWSNGSYGRGWCKVKVTSIAERGRTGKTEFWTNDQGAVDHRGSKKPERKKLSEIYLRADTPENDQAVASIVALKKQREQIEEQIRETERRMAPIVVPSE